MPNKTPPLAASRITHHCPGETRSCPPQSETRLMMRPGAASDAPDRAATYPWTAWQIGRLDPAYPRLEECSYPLSVAPWPQRRCPACNFMYVLRPHLYVSVLLWASRVLPTGGDRLGSLSSGRRQVRPAGAAGPEVLGRGEGWVSGAAPDRREGLLYVQPPVSLTGGESRHDWEWEPEGGVRGKASAVSSTARDSIYGRVVASGVLS